MPIWFPRTSNNLPVTLLASSLQSQAAVTACHRGDIDSFCSSVRLSIPTSPAVILDKAAGTSALTVTLYLASSIAVITVNAAIPAFAAP